MERTDFEQWKAKEVARLLALVETERRYYQEMVASLPVPLVVLSAEKAVVWANRAFRRTFGLRVEELRRKDIEQVLPVEGLGDWIREIHARGAGVPPLAAQVGLDTFRIAGVPMRNWDDESEVETLLMVEQIAGPGSMWAPAQAAQPAALRPSQAVPEEVPAVVWQADAATLAFRTVGGAVEELLGFPADHWTSRSGFFEERIHPEDRAATLALYRSAIETGGDASAEFRAVSASGQAVWCRESLRPAGDTVTGVMTPIGRRKQIEQQLLAAGRMEGLQAFAARLAHDLNNPLMIATGYGEEILNTLPADSAARGDLAEVLKATERISELAGRLTELAQRHANPPTRVNLSEVLAGMESRLAQSIGEVTLEIIHTYDPVWAEADAEQLAGVIETLASPERAGSEERTRLTVAWDADTIAERTTPVALAPGRYARITLRDDGRGVESTRLAAVFDPLLAPGKGAGLAMARAYAIVRQWGGDIAYTSEPFRGSAYTVYLPSSEPEPAPVAEAVPEEAVAPVAAPTVAEPEPEPMRETILVVDDEAGIRGLMRKILRRERYVVVEAGSAEEALAAAEAHGQPFDLLLTDVMLPGMLGPELARQMYAAQPSLKVLYISGYTPDEAVRSGDSPPGARFLPKPFTLGALLSKVRETLDA